VPWECVYGYMSWYLERSHPYIQNPNNRIGKPEIKHSDKMVNVLEFIYKLISLVQELSNTFDNNLHIGYGDRRSH